MYKLAIFLFALAAALCLHCEAKIFSRCELVRELRRQRFPERELRDWVCLIEKESGSNTAIVSKGMWGLFQISQYYWCSTGSSPGMGCNVRCAELITDNITKASTCAKLIKQRQSFTAWTKWRTECNGKPENLPNIANC